MKGSTPNSSKGRILVVDDDRLVLATVSHGLSQAGYAVIDADNGDDAILLTREHRPELALLDIRMEGMTGFDVAEYLRDVAQVPFIFLSAFTDGETRRRVGQLGALAYLVKPLEVGQIVPVVEQAFSRLRGGGTATASAPVTAPAPPEAASAAAAPDLVSVALGILMHRHSLTLADAGRRLDRLAHDKGLTPAAQAARLVAAIEDLAGPAED